MDWPKEKIIKSIKTMTIFKTLIAANAVINSRKTTSGMAYQKACKDMDYCVDLLKKGYSPDDDIKMLLVKYKHIAKVPDARVHAGKGMTPNKLQDYMDLVFPKLPHGYVVMILVQKLGDTLVNYISNIERQTAIKALRELADNMEKGKDFEMTHPN